MVGGSFKTFVDLLVTTLPIPLILRMNMTRAQRYGLVFLLGLGYVVTAAGALRTYYSWRVYYGDSYDYTWEQFPAFVASAVENNLAVVSVRLKHYCTLQLIPFVDLRMHPHAPSPVLTDLRPVNQFHPV